MTDSSLDPPPGRDDLRPLEHGLRFAFGKATPNSERSPAHDHASVLDTLTQRTGSPLHLHLPEADEGHTPVVMVPGRGEPELGSGRYHVVGEVARGGVGVVYKGRDHGPRPRRGDEGAARTSTPSIPTSSQRFVEEAQIGGQLQHPGIVPVYELGLQAGERPYFAMKLVKGRDAGRAAGAAHA